MTTKHTPGPWVAMDVRDGRGNPCAFSVWPNRKFATYERRGAHNQICRTPDGLTPENKANAHLISAAPEMLAALLDVEALLTKVAQDMNGPDFDMTQEAAPAWWLGNVGSARNKAIEAIRKAKGES